jgi:hypothetical protein
MKPSEAYKKYIRKNNLYEEGRICGFAETLLHWMDKQCILKPKKKNK